MCVPPLGGTQNANVPWNSRKVNQPSMEFQQIPASAIQGGKQNVCWMFHQIPVSSRVLVFSLLNEPPRTELGCRIIEVICERGWNEKEMTVIEMEHMGIPSVPK